MEQLRCRLACAIACCCHLMYQAQAAVKAVLGLSSSLLDLQHDCSGRIAHKVGTEPWELYMLIGQAFDRCNAVHALE